MSERVNVLVFQQRKCVLLMVRKVKTEMSGFYSDQKLNVQCSVYLCVCLCVCNIWVITPSPVLINVNNGIFREYTSSTCRVNSKWLINFVLKQL